MRRCFLRRGEKSLSYPALYAMSGNRICVHADDQPCVFDISGASVAILTEGSTVSCFDRETGSCVEVPIEDSLPIARDVHIDYIRFKYQPNAISEYLEGAVKTPNSFIML